MDRQDGIERGGRCRKRRATSEIGLETRLSGPANHSGRCGGRAEGRLCGEWPICLFGPGEGYYRPWPGDDFRPGHRDRLGIGRRLLLDNTSHNCALS